MKPGRWSPNTPETFWARCSNRADPNACWEWQGARKALGYGKLSYDRRVTTAHRVAYTLAFGPIPEGGFVCHRCDNPPCCNPRHLFLGTARDNTHDMLVKGRGYFPGARVPLRGSNHYMSKLTDEQRAEIAASTEPQRDLAARYGVSHGTISRIQIAAGRRRNRPPTRRQGASE